MLLAILAVLLPIQTAIAIILAIFWRDAAMRLKAVEAMKDFSRPNLNNEQAMVLAARASLKLEERLKALGLRAKHHGDMEDVPDSLRSLFCMSGLVKPFLTICRRCHHPVDEIDCDNPVLSPSALGYFCRNCGYGALYEGINDTRRYLGFPPLPDRNLFAILNVLERVAFEKGILREPTTEQLKSCSFEVILQETAGYRGPPLKARVDIEAQTVTLVDETAHSGQPLRLVK